MVMVLSSFCFFSCEKTQEEPFERLLEDQVIHSGIFSSEIKYAVLLPEDYDSTEESYPVVYLLHGYGDDQTAWYKYGLIRYYSDLYAADNVPMIFVMPQGFNSYYVNRSSGNLRYMDFFTQELVPEIDSLFRTRKEASQRAVMGYSMGGYGALILTAKNPGLFGISVPLSMSFRTDEQYMTEPQEVFDIQWALIFGGLHATGAERLTGYFLEYSPFHFFDTEDVSAYTGIRMFMDCGDDEEQLSVTAGALHNLMMERRIPHEFRVRNGGHSWDYWKRALPEALHFISCGFEGTAYPEEPEVTGTGEGIPEGSLDLFTAGENGRTVAVLRPETYDEGTGEYPVIWYFSSGSVEPGSENALKTLSYLHKAMQENTIPHALLVEIPEGSSAPDSLELATLMVELEARYRVLPGNEGKVLLGHGEGAASIAALAGGFTDRVNACFLFGAALTGGEEPAEDIFYYVDYTDKSPVFSGNYAFYLKLRESGTAHEYRVRQGSEPFQAFINGLDGSISYLSRRLKS